MGHSVAIEVKTTLMGVKSGNSKSIQGEVINEVEGNSPVASGLLSLAGAKGKKSILNNPLAQLIISNFMNRVPSQVSNSGNNHKEEQSAFIIK